MLPEAGLIEVHALVPDTLHGDDTTNNHTFINLFTLVNPTTPPDNLDLYRLEQVLYRFLTGLSTYKHLPKTI